MAKVNLKIITPEGYFWNDAVEIITLKTSEGYIGLQHGRSPFVASLAIAELKINHAGQKNYRICAIAGGLVSATGSEVHVITDAIEYKDKIEIARAENAKRIAQMALKKALSDEEKFQAELALKKAINRIHVGTSK